MEFNHIPVMLSEAVEGLSVKPGGVYVDATLGGGGHSAKILSELGEGRLIAFDLDEWALNNARERFAGEERITLVNDNFKRIPEVLTDMGIDKIDGTIFDLGISSPQIDTPERGFSYMHDAPLDMRMDLNATKNAYDVVNGYSEEALTGVFREYGEEKAAYRIAEDIVRTRKVKPIESTFELVKIIERHYPANPRKRSGHPAKRVFQALRIEVNDELDGLSEAIEKTTLRLKPGGRIAVITFHSLEDRIVKNVFKELEKDCTCPKNFPVCVCGKRKEIEVLTKKPITAGEEELTKNPRAASAKLRIAERV